MVCFLHKWLWREVTGSEEKMNQNTVFTQTTQFYMNTATFSKNTNKTRPRTKHTAFPYVKTQSHQANMKKQATSQANYKHTLLNPAVGKPQTARPDQKHLFH
jgi:hypothetical protein